MQSTNTVFIVRPANFNYNAETALSNAFQNTSANVENISEKAIEEFDAFANKLQQAGIHALVFQDSATPIKPDAIFPNNWISLHANGNMVLYPMCTPNRRIERSENIINALKSSFNIQNIIDLSHYEAQDKFLEGTGSIVFDHINRLAYACISVRTNEDVLNELCEKIGYKAIAFTANDASGKAIYHTNVMMCIAEKVAIICFGSISNTDERKAIENLLIQTGHEIVDISFEQMNQFAGNMLAVLNNKNETILVMSQSAYTSLHATQIATIEKSCTILPMPIPTIETIGGGSARCMIAEVFSKPL